MKKEIYIPMIIFTFFIGGLFMMLELSTSDIGKRIQDNDITDFQQKNDTIVDSEPEYGFKSLGLDTNTVIASIDLDLVLNGGPGKDGIPSINETKFFQVGDEINQKGLNDDILGLSIERDGESKFYPYSVLYWHEIVNDTIGDKNIAVTFCPLCGSAIVYERLVDDKEVVFGVSGMLYESNLLMYDDLTHTLWSQSIGEAVAGDYTGAELNLIRSNLITYEKYKELYPAGLVLSEDTGFVRAYDRTPYGSYESDNDLYFPVINSDERLHKKELLFVLPYRDQSYAFIRKALKDVGILDFPIDGEIIHIVYDEGIVSASIKGKDIPGYTEMFFSWATQHPESENLWGIEND